MVRPLGAVRKYVKNGGIADADGKKYCGAPNCPVTKKNTKFQGSKWAEQIVLECREWSEEVKAEFARDHPTEKILKYYVPQMPSWKRKCTTDTDPIVTAEDVDDAAVAGAAEESASKQQKKMHDYGDRCDNARAEKIIGSITKFLLGCALPFAIVDSVFFIEMITALN